MCRLFALCFLFSRLAPAGEIFTNNVKIPSPPSWLSPSRVETVTGKIQNVLEWDIHRVTVTFYSDQAAFQAVHGFGPAVIAYSRPSDNTIHIGPKVGKDNFDNVFGHELAHVVVAQKYKSAIPKWIEEGLANYVSKTKLDYAWLAKEPPRDVTTLTHPFKGQVDYKYHYAASTAVMEMIASKCSLSDLLQLSVGKKLETYLDTYCNIPDVNAEFRKWIESKRKLAGKGAK